MSKDKAYKKLQNFEDSEMKKALLTILEAKDLIMSKLAKGNVSQNDKDLTYDVIRDITSISTAEHSDNSFSLEEVKEKNNIDNDSQGQNKNDEPKDSNRKELEAWMNTLRTIKDKATYEHIIASIQEIYTKQLSYSDTVNNICSEVLGIKQNQEVFDALFNLSEAMAGLNKAINSNYKFSSEDEVEIDVAGDVYDFTIEHIY